MKLVELDLKLSEEPNYQNFVMWLEKAKKDVDFDPKEVNTNEDMFNQVKRKIMTKVKNGTVYRAISIYKDDNIVDALLKNKNRLGISWTYDIDLANVYRSHGANYESKYIIMGKVKEKDVDLYMTIALNLIPVRGSYEGEIRLEPNSNIKIISVFDFDDKKPITQDITKLKTTSFFA